MAADPHSFAFVAACAILAATYALVITEWVNRALVALVGAGLVIVLGVLHQDEAVRAIDFNTLGLLAGMMTIVAVAKKSGVFGYVAVASAQAARGSPAAILIALGLVTALLSAALDNVTTVMLVVPVTFVVCGELKVPVYPFLVTEILTSNIGGAATLIGDPPNILIGSAAGLSFNDFLVNVGPPAAIILVVQLAICHFVWGVKLHATPADRERLMRIDARNAIQNRYLLICSLIVIAGVIAAFVFAHQLGLEAATIALMGGAVLLILENVPFERKLHSGNVNHAFREIEWVTLFFFLGLFVVVGAVARVGALDILGQALMRATGGDPQATALGVLWSSAFLSAIIDNIPFVTTMIPLVKGLAPHFGGAHGLLPIWWALSLGACLGGNGTLVGASANLTVAGLAEKNGVPFSFVTYAKAALPMMILSIAISHAYMMWRYF